MKSGTPGFVGERLKEARQIRGLTATSLAEMSGVSPQSISNYEKGRSTPSPETHMRLVQVLGIPERYFLASMPAMNRTRIFYRSLSSATKTARTRAEHRFTWLRRIYEHLATLDVHFPASNFPVFDVTWQDLDDHDIEDLAARARGFWNLPRGPITNVVSLLENNGAIVARDILGSDKLDGLSEMVDRPYVLLGADKGTAVRWRFDAAHELGHVLLHQSVTDVDLSNRDIHKRLESQAHRFAGAFLLPAEDFGEDLAALNLDALRALKPKWQTSISMMIRRLLDTEFISEDRYRSLMINLGRRKWRKHEPYDDVLEPEIPLLLAKAIGLVIEAEIRTAEDLVQEIMLPPRDIETLASLPEGFLTNKARVSLNETNVIPLNANRGRH